MQTIMTIILRCQAMRLYLASESPRRRVLLERVVGEFAVESAQVDELSASAELTPTEVASYNAAIKADAVARKHPESWVLGADTIVVMADKIYGKPRDLAEAKVFLREFSGREHKVLTAVALRKQSEECKVDFISVSRVRFRELDEEVIEKYLSLVPVLDKAGAYGIQEYGEMLVESWDGELENIIGLPVAELKRCFCNIGIL